MTIEILTTGDSFSRLATLTEDDAAVEIPLDATVTAAIVSYDHETKLSEEAVQSAAADGAVWGSGIVNVTFAPADTADIVRQGPAWLELQVDDDGEKSTWYAPVKIIRGQVS